jgi:pyruvate,water dikinase
VLVELLGRARRELATVHQYEVLAGMLLHGTPAGVPAALIALDALHEARERGWSDAETIRRRPVVLCLSPPSLGPVELPSAPPRPVHEPCGLDALDEREALRLRARWLQQLVATAVDTLARRLVDDGVLARPDLIRELGLAELAAAADGDVPHDLAARSHVIDGPPLPSRFRLTGAGGVVPLDGERHEAAGMPASGGRAVGVAARRVTPGAPRDGTILVVDHLEPSLAPLLPSVDGLVAETGSALSHLAILAREMGVPAVVGVADARRRFPPGTPLVVDGDAGDVCAVDERARGGRAIEGVEP